MRNRLTGLTSPGFSASFAYDALGRRTGKMVQGVTTNFVYDGLNPVQEKNGATVTANLLTGLGIDQVFTRTDGTGTREFFSSALGSTVALADTSGAVQTSYTYEPFGGTTQSGGANTNSYKYTGREDDGTGLYYYRARYYSPRLQRFVSEDPIGFAGRDANVYAYVRNMPQTFTDPLGLFELNVLSHNVVVEFSVCLLAACVSNDLRGLRSWDYYSLEGLVGPSAGLSLDVKIDPPTPTRNCPVARPFVGVGRNFSIGTNVIHEPGTGDRVQGLNISIGPSIGVPFGIQIPILPFPTR